MPYSLLSPAVITWILFIPIAITNGIIREKWYKTITGDLLAHQISTIIASIAFIMLSHFMLKSIISTATTGQLLGIGLLWLIMTVCFEFGFGHFIDGASWSKLLADYNIFKGHVWGLFLLVIFLTPFIVKLLKM